MVVTVSGYVRTEYNILTAIHYYRQGRSVFCFSVGWYYHEQGAAAHQSLAALQQYAFENASNA